MAISRDALSVILNQPGLTSSGEDSEFEIIMPTPVKAPAPPKATVHIIGSNAFFAMQNANLYFSKEEQIVGHQKSCAIRGKTQVVRIAWIGEQGSFTAKARREYLERIKNGSLEACASNFDPLASLAVTQTINSKKRRLETSAARKPTLFEKKMIEETSDPNNVKSMESLHSAAEELSSEEVTANIVAETLRDGLQQDEIGHPQELTSIDQGLAELEVPLESPELHTPLHQHKDHADYEENSSQQAALRPASKHLLPATAAWEMPEKIKVATKVAVYEYAEDLSLLGAEKVPGRFQKDGNVRSTPHPLVHGFRVGAKLIFHADYIASHCYGERKRAFSRAPLLPEDRDKLMELKYFLMRLSKELKIPYIREFHLHIPKMFNDLGLNLRGNTARKMLPKKSMKTYPTTSTVVSDSQDSTSRRVLFDVNYQQPSASSTNSLPTRLPTAP